MLRILTRTPFFLERRRFRIPYTTSKILLSIRISLSKCFYMTSSSTRLSVCVLRQMGRILLGILILAYLRDKSKSITEVLTLHRYLRLDFK